METPFGKLPSQIYCEGDSHHVQGVAVDLQKRCAWFSFTTSLIRTDFEGNVTGSVTGLSCHLGCIDLEPESGKLYGSMEYKDDVIGKSISDGDSENAFYIGIFDTRKIDRIGIDASDGRVLKGAFLREVKEFYEGQCPGGEHIYGCSGIDGTALGPKFGSQRGNTVLNVALGIYGDNSRTDNDYQVILQYDPHKLEKDAQPMGALHSSGPGPGKRFFAYTGNTNWGVQNLEYDPYTNYWLMAVYPGAKAWFPNFSLFAFDGRVKPQRAHLQGFAPSLTGMTLTMASDGVEDSETGIRGWRAKADTGIESLGQGYFYISVPGKSTDGKQNCTLVLCRWTGDAGRPFQEL